MISSLVLYIPLNDDALLLLLLMDDDDGTMAFESTTT